MTSVAIGALRVRLVWPEKSLVCLEKNGHSQKDKNGFQDRLSHNTGPKYCRMFPLEHSAILWTFIKLPVVIIH